MATVVAVLVVVMEVVVLAEVVLAVLVGVINVKFAMPAPVKGFSC